ncbi:IS1096 element passenger TnpR family protein [Rossellomorea sp. YZS02]
MGAEPGFDQFLSIIQAPSHPEHSEMKEWGEMQGYEELDIKEINWRLKML